MKYEWPPPGYADRASWWFAGYVLGLLTACALAIVFGGCWTQPPDVVEPQPPAYPPSAQNQLSCGRLVQMVGRVPFQPLFAECASGTNDDYWYCKSVQNERYAADLRNWVMMAIAECAQ